MATWVKQQGPMAPVKFDNIEITRDLPNSLRALNPTLKRMLMKAVDILC